MLLLPLEILAIGWMRVSKLEELDTFVGILESRNMMREEPGKAVGSENRSLDFANV